MRAADLKVIDLQNRTMWVCFPILKMPVVPKIASAYDTNNFAKFGDIKDWIRQQKSVGSIHTIFPDFWSVTCVTFSVLRAHVIVFNKHRKLVCYLGLD